MALEEEEKLGHTSEYLQNFTRGGNEACIDDSVSVTSFRTSALDDPQDKTQNLTSAEESRTKAYRAEKVYEECKEEVIDNPEEEKILGRKMKASSQPKYPMS